MLDLSSEGMTSLFESLCSARTSQATLEATHIYAYLAWIEEQQLFHVVNSSVVFGVGVNVGHGRMQQSQRCEYMGYVPVASAKDDMVSDLLGGASQISNADVKVRRTRGGVHRDVDASFMQLGY